MSTWGTADFETLLVAGVQVHYHHGIEEFIRGYPPVLREAEWEQIWGRIRETLLRMKDVCFPDDSIDDLGALLGRLEEPNVYQEVARDFVMALLQRIVRFSNLTIECDRVVVLNYEGERPTRVTINTTIFNENQPIMIVQPRRAGALIKKSVVHCLMQLFALKTSMNVQHTLYGLLTDARQYIFVALDRNGNFHLFRDEVGGVQVWRVDEWLDLKTRVAPLIDQLLRGVRHEMGNDLEVEGPGEAGEPDPEEEDPDIEKI